MALVESKFCNKCEKYVVHTNNKCNLCHQKERQEYLLRWNAMSDEDKFIDLRKRIEQLEAKPIRY